MLLAVFLCMALASHDPTQVSYCIFCPDKYNTLEGLFNIVIDKAPLALDINKIRSVNYFENRLEYLTLAVKYTDIAITHYMSNQGPHADDRGVLRDSNYRIAELCQHMRMVFPDILFTPLWLSEELNNNKAVLFGKVTKRVQALKSARKNLLLSVALYDRGDTLSDGSDHVTVNTMNLVAAMKQYLEAIRNALDLNITVKNFSKYGNVVFNFREAIDNINNVITSRILSHVYDNRVEDAKAELVKNDRELCLTFLRYLYVLPELGDLSGVFNFKGGPQRSENACRLFALYLSYTIEDFPWDKVSADILRIPPGMLTTFLNSRDLEVSAIKDVYGWFKGLTVYQFLQLPYDEDVSHPFLVAFNNLSLRTVKIPSVQRVVAEADEYARGHKDVIQSGYPDCRYTLLFKVGDGFKVLFRSTFAEFYPSLEDIVRYRSYCCFHHRQVDNITKLFALVYPAGLKDPQLEGYDGVCPLVDFNEYLEHTVAHMERCIQHYETKDLLQPGAGDSLYGIDSNYRLAELCHNFDVAFPDILETHLWLRDPPQQINVADTKLERLKRARQNIYSASVFYERGYSTDEGHISHNTRTMIYVMRQFLAMVGESFGLVNAPQYPKKNKDDACASPNVYIFQFAEEMAIVCNTIHGTDWKDPSAVKRVIASDELRLQFWRYCHTLPDLEACTHFAKKRGTNESPIWYFRAMLMRFQIHHDWRTASLDKDTNMLKKYVEFLKAFRLHPDLDVINAIGSVYIAGMSIAEFLLLPFSDEARDSYKQVMQNLSLADIGASGVQKEISDIAKIGEADIAKAGITTLTDEQEWYQSAMRHVLLAGLAAAATPWCSRHPYGCASLVVLSLVLGLLGVTTLLYFVSPDVLLDCGVNIDQWFGIEEPVDNDQKKPN